MWRILERSKGTRKSHQDAIQRFRINIKPSCPRWSRIAKFKQRLRKCGVWVFLHGTLCLSVMP
jgi:hypothetical protein